MKVAVSTWAQYELEETTPQPEIFDRIVKFATSVGFCYPVYVSAVVLFDALAQMDPKIKDHQLRVADRAEHVGRVLCYSRKDVGVLAVASSLLDIGKIVLSARLLRPRVSGPPPVSESKALKEHVYYSASIVEKIFGSNDFSRRCARIVLQHHERVDGSGYPVGLKASKIDSLSKIAAACDVFDTLMSEIDGWSGAQKKDDMYSVIEKIQRPPGRFDADVLSALKYTVKHANIEKLNHKRLKVHA